VACCAAIVTAVAIGACGSSVPSNAVAAVGNAKVLKTAFVHWLTVANDSNYVGTGTTPPPVPLPPDYTACVAASRATAKVAKGTSKTAALEKACAASFSALMPTVIEFLVQDYWVQGEAVDRHVHVSNASVLKTYNTEVKQEFPTTAKFNTFLAESGETVADLKWRALEYLLEGQIVDKVKAGAAKVTNAQIATFYKDHSSEFTEPARRNIEFVLVAKAGTAATVKSLLAGGASYATVAKKYSIDPTTKKKGGVADGVVAGEETPLFSTAIFKARTGVLSGPVKTAFGYYVFTVTKATTGSVVSLAAARSGIKSELKTSHQTTALNSLQSNFTKKWRARTHCASGYLVSLVCTNAPTSSTGSSGATSATSGAT
jgi:foldase protein PrsA